MGTYCGEITPYVCSEQNDSRDNKKGTFTPDVGTCRGEEGRKPYPESKKANDQTCNLVDANIVLHRNERKAWSYHWSKPASSQCRIV